MPIPIQCGVCGASYTVADAHAGGAVTCPRCKNTMAVPTLAIPVATAVAPPPIDPASVSAAARQRLTGLSASSAAIGGLSLAGHALTKRFNLRFRDYVTSSLAVMLWWISVLAFFAYFLMGVGGSDQEEAARMALPRFFGSILALLATRIALETVSVLFDIAQTLHALLDVANKKP